MLTLEQQTQVDEFLDGLKSIEHPISDFFSMLRDFENPSKELYERVSAYYLRYLGSLCSDNILDNFDKVLDYAGRLYSIQNSVFEGVKKLGIHLDSELNSEAIENFYMFLCGMRPEIYELQYPEERLKREREQLIKNQLRESKKILEGEVQKYIDELRPHIENLNSGLDLRQVIDTLNTLFSSTGLIETSSGHEKVQIQTQPYFHTPHISDRMKYMIEKENCSMSINLDSQFRILFNMLEYFWKRKDFWNQIEAFRPNEEILAELERDKMKYGAKGAYLRFLKNMLSHQVGLAEHVDVRKFEEEDFAISDLFGNDEATPASVTRKTKERIGETIQIDRMDGFHIELLPSLEIDTELYTSWKSGKNIDRELEEIYERARNEFSQEESEDETDYFSRKKGLPKEISGLIVRSSAVYSEDSEKTSGAGIYESVGDIQSLEDFKQAVITVFESVESEKAQAHRKAFNIPEEYMGLVVMPFMHAPKKSMGYVNMQRPGKPNLVDIKDMSGKHAVLQKDLLPVDLLTQYNFGSFFSHMYQVDVHSSEVGFQLSNYGMVSSLKTMFFLSQYFPYPLQFEIISESSMRSERVFIVQMRPLNFQNQQNLCIPEFPNQEPIYEGKAIIPCDIIVDVKQILIKYNSHEATVRGLRHIGYYKAVIMTESFSAADGHIETLCSERGIPCICENRFESPRELDLSAYEKVRIVSDGEIARIYPA